MFTPSLMLAGRLNYGEITAAENNFTSGGASVAGQVYLLYQLRSSGSSGTLAPPTIGAGWNTFVNEYRTGSQNYGGSEGGTNYYRRHVVMSWWIGTGGAIPDFNFPLHRVIMANTKEKPLTVTSGITNGFNTAALKGPVSFFMGREVLSSTQPDATINGIAANPAWSYSRSFPTARERFGAWAGNFEKQAVTIAATQSPLIFAVSRA